VRDNNVDQALRVLKKKMQREGVFREMKRRRFYEKPSERSAREQNEARRRARKQARKNAQRDGLLPAPRNKKALVPKLAGRGAIFGRGRTAATKPDPIQPNQLAAGPLSPTLAWADKEPT
jgi:small subunit ribosomal protein S21